MARRGTHKTKILLIYQLLRTKGDEAHPISTAALLRELEENGIFSERKSLYDDMAALQEMGIDVQCRKGKDGGWFLGEREFELPELKLLVDAVQSSRFISRKKSNALIRKLEGLTSEYQARQLRRQVYVDRRVKTGNEKVYYAIDKLHAAIAEGKSVTFRYFDYNVNKEQIFRRNGKKYEVSPYGLIWSDENYYLVGWDHQERELRHYRVDKMETLTVTDTGREGDSSCRQFDLAEYGKKHFHMFSGKEANVRLRCGNKMVNVMLDRFGIDVMLIPDDAEHFTLTVDAVVSPQFYAWIFGLAPDVELTAPAWAVEEYQKMLKAALDG